MPVLNLQYSGEGNQPDGSVVTLTPSQAFSVRGPLIQVSISVEQHMAEQLLQQGATLPQPVVGLALLDTGASSTCIDEALAQQLGVSPVDIVHVASASHAATEQSVYPARLEIVGSPITINAPRAIGGPLSAQGILALMGRDVLQSCTLFCNGLTDQISLAI
jgi:predicted aspartyl protease